MMTWRELRFGGGTCWGVAQTWRCESMVLVVAEEDMVLVAEGMQDRSRRFFFERFKGKGRGEKGDGEKKEMRRGLSLTDAAMDE